MKRNSRLFNPQDVRFKDVIFEEGVQKQFPCFCWISMFDRFVGFDVIL